jgi:hypothetical protein
MRPQQPVNRRGCGLLFVGALSFVVALPIDLAAQPKDKNQPPIRIEDSVQPWPPQPPQSPQSPTQPYKQPVPPFAGAMPGLIVIALAIWALQQKLQQEEEEEVTPISADPAAGFEYKIMRSAFGSFKDPLKLRAMLEEEARAGWEMFEKLDDGRVRLRRSVACRQRDADLGQDPYRTNYRGAGGGKVLLWVVVGIVAVCAVVTVGIIVGTALSK